jgi:hypothetical protein
MPRPNNRPPVNLTPKYRKWAVGSSRDERIDGSPARGHTAKFREHRGAFTCFKCGAPVDDCGLFCALHLWTLDNPVLRDAEIFLSVSPMLLERSARYPNNKAVVL